MPSALASISSRRRPLRDRTITINGREPCCLFVSSRWAPFRKSLKPLSLGLHLFVFILSHLSSICLYTALGIENAIPKFSLDFLVRAGTLRILETELP